MKNKIRIYQLASDLNLPSSHIVDIANSLDIKISSHLSIINEKDKSAIIKFITNKNDKKLNTTTILFDQNEITPDIANNIKKIFQEIKTIDDLASLINRINKYIYGDRSHNIKKRYLTYYAYHAKNKYTVFEIPKKSGGTREIYAPSKGLKKILVTLNIIFQSIYKNHMACHGFAKNRSVATNAKHHTNKNYVYNIDLKNFFTSIHQARVWKRLQYPPFNLKQDITNLIANLVCYQYSKGENKKNFLPQGAPTSPVLSNIICERLDRKLFKLAKDYNLKYTRYADDMTFSSDHNVYQDNSDFLHKLHKIIEDENFELNNEKTRLQKRGYRQEVTGLIVNDKVNVSRKYIKNLRMLIHLVNKYGEKKAQNIFNKNYKANKPQKENIPSIRLVIYGKLEYLKMVKGHRDNTYKTLLKKFYEVFKIDATEEPKEIEDKKNKNKAVAITKSIDCEHRPKELANILNSFTQNNNPLKYATHSWEEGKFVSYDDFIAQIRQAWKKIDKDLKRYSRNLHAKIYTFLFSSELGNENKKGYINTWGEHRVKIGWSSPELKKWCTDGNKPLEYRLSDSTSFTVGSEDIETFYDVAMKVFKHEIEIKTDNNRLKYLFLDIADKLLGFDFNVTDENLEGKDFYTDVQWLRSALNKIFEEIKKRTTHPNIVISAIDKDNILEIKILQVGAVPNKTSEQLLDRINKGSFGSITNELCSLCDWSIEAKCEDGNYRINYLKQKETKAFEKISNEPKGFTYILRFYK